MNIMKNMTIGENVKRIRAEQKMSQKDLAERLGKEQSYVSRFESDEFKNPSYDTICAFARALGVSAIALIADEGETYEVTSKTNEFSALKLIPLLAGTVSAGDFVQPFDDWKGETIPIPSKSSNGKVGWKISGQSMAPEYNEGDIAVIDTALDALEGYDVVARNNGGVTIKTYKKFKDGSVELRPLNPDFPTLRFDDTNGHDLQIVGVVVMRIENKLKRRK